MPNPLLIRTMSDAARRVREEDDRERAIDWQARRAWWVEHVVSLFDDMTRWAEALRDEGIVDEIHRSEISISEDMLGSYAAPRLVVSLRRRETRFTPVGTLLLGAVGRIDVSGSGGSARLILAVPEGMDPSAYRNASRWYVSERPAGVALIPLDEEAFVRLLATMLRLNETE